MKLQFDAVQSTDRAEAIRDGIARAAYRGDYGHETAVEIGRLAATFDAAIPGLRPSIAIEMQRLVRRKTARNAA